MIMKRNYFQFDQIIHWCLFIGYEFSMGPKNSTCKSGLVVKSGVVKSGKINIVKACEKLGLR